MSQNEQPIEWFLARDGQRHGPISDVELRKFIEFGHLKPTDLVWRMGFTNWEMAGTVFPPPSPRPTAPPPPAAPAAVVQPPPTSPAPSPQKPAQASAPTGAPAPAASALPSPAKPQPGTPHGSAPYPAASAPVREPSAEADPLRHRRVPHPGPDPQTRRASGYGEIPHQANLGAPPVQGPQHGPSSPASAMSAGTASSPVPRPSIGEARGLPLPLDEDAGDVEPRRRGPWRIIAAIIALLLLGTGGLVLYRTGLVPLSILGPAKPLPVVKAPQETLKESPLKTFAGSAEEVDANFQKAALWKLMKKEFPDWYKERVAETVKLRADNRNDLAIADHLTKALVELRRKHTADAFAAGPAHLRSMAQAFVDNLSRLAKIGTEECYRFIAGGETDPKMIELMRSPEHTASMQTQMLSIFEAIVDGRMTKAKHEQAARKDYDTLAGQLAVRGWSAADLALFDDARALSQAPPQKVCQMVNDWFAAQLAIKDSPTQTRLFVSTLKPLIGG